MALADIPTPGQRRRLDSWKEIAEYLGRDVRTATRWESQGLPLHRVPGGRGTSVFAYTNEIDDWMAGRPAAAAAPPLDARPKGRTVIAAVIAIVAVAGAGLFYWNPFDSDALPLRVAATSTELTLADPSGATRVLYRFPPGAILVPKAPARLTDVDGDGTAEVFVAVAAYDDTAARTKAQGELLRFAPDGAPAWRFAFDDVITFSEKAMPGPWAISDWLVDGMGSRNRIAVAAHDFTWWGSIVTVLDASGGRLGSFVNPGWLESVLWLPDGRLAAGGFNNMRDEAVLTVLDASRVDGQAPGSRGTPFACLSCGDAEPLFYATFARSEVNRVTASRFNRAQVAALGDLILVTTSETGPDRGEVNALYEFDREMRLVRARYSDRYWDEHRRLELEGRLTHSRATCPEREGPATIHVWSSGRWQRLQAPH